MLIPLPENFETAPRFPRNFWLLALVLIITLFLTLLIPTLISMRFPPQLLTDPFLQLPTETSVRVVWFTEFPGSQHTVAYGPDFKQIVGATTSKLSRTREDQKSRVWNQTEDGTLFQKPTLREIWRHEAEIVDLIPNNRVPYQVTSVREDGQSVNSDIFTLAPAPIPGTPLKILLTSDHQMKPMTAANLQKVSETVGSVDAIFFAGDLQNIPDRASEWFDDNRGGAFFPCLQGRAHYELEKNGVKTVYRGGQIIQHAPLFPAVGNHEVMGRFSTEKNLNDQFNDTFPRSVAEQIYQEKAKELNPENSPVFRDIWLTNHSFNLDTFSEIFTLPQNRSDQQKTGKPRLYYAVTFGDVRLVVAFITNMWRLPGLNSHTKGRYREREQDLNHPENWGYGQHIFEPISKGSQQYRWLEKELNSPEFQQAKYKIVMFHHPPHSLGENIVPAYTDPVQRLDQDAMGRITIRYEYPIEKNYIIRDVVPLLESARVQLVLYGHSHLWNRFVSDRGMHFLETSNVGNTYGAYIGDKKRPMAVEEEFSPPRPEKYLSTRDPYGLDPAIPTIAPLRSENGQPLPYLASNDITAFSIFDTGTGLVSSYYFDTRKPDSDVVKFDEFKLKS